VETSQIIWIVVAVVVVLAIVAVLAMMNRKRKQSRSEAARNRAGELRQDAASGAAGLETSRSDAHQARAQADAAQARAAEAEERAAMEEAAVEDRVREADRVDPDLDHRSDDYRPEVPGPGSEATPSQHPDRSGETDPPRSEGGSHRA
jgi:FtsZ-interacting cell division protein ZipA